MISRLITKIIVLICLPGIKGIGGSIVRISGSENRVMGIYMEFWQFVSFVEFARNEASDYSGVLFFEN